MTTTADSSGNGYDGTFVGSTPPVFVPSPWTGFGAAVSFDGVDRGYINTQGIDCGTATALGIGGVGAAAAFTLEAKVRTGSSVATDGIVAGRLTAGAHGFLLYVDSGTRFAAQWMDNGGATRQIVGPTTVVANTSYDVAMAYDGTTMRLLVNGTVVASLATTGIITPPAGVHFFIGRFDSVISNPFAAPWLGTIDEVRLSSVARYTAGYMPASTPVVTDASTIGLWHLESTTPDSWQYLVAFNNAALDDPGLITTIAAPGTAGSPNLLDAETASGETGVGGWVSANGNTAVPFSTTTNGAVDGTHNITLQPVSGTHNIEVATDAAKVLVRPNTVYTGFAEVSPWGALRDYAVSLRWWDVAGLLISEVQVAPDASEGAGWAIKYGALTSPSDAFSASLGVAIRNAAEQHSIDCAGIFEGTVTTWAPGSVPTLGANNVWTDISQYVASHTYTRGRQHELDRFETGTATLDLINMTAVFNPWNTSSPFAGCLLPGKLVQIRRTFLGVTYIRYTGIIGAWPITWPDEMIGGAELTASDAFKNFALADITGTWSDEPSGTRIDHVLDTVGWSAGARNTDTGNTTVQGVTGLATTKALTYMQLVEETENGALFMAGDGQVRFMSRHSFQSGPPTTVKMTLGDNTGAGEIPFQPGPNLALDDVDIWNDITVTRAGGTPQNAQDAASIDAYGTRSQPLDGLLMTTDFEAADRAAWQADFFAQPVTRLRQIGIRPAAQPASIPTILSLELLDRIVVNRGYIPGGGTTFSQTALIERMTESADAESGDWTIGYDLAPADTRAYWILDDPVFSLLDSTTRLTY